MGLVLCVFGVLSVSTKYLEAKVGVTLNKYCVKHLLG